MEEIVGRLIPAGTGLDFYHQFSMEQETFDEPALTDDEVYFQFDEDIRSLPTAAAATAEKS